MSEMVERVARALANEEGYAYDPVPYNRRARAAIEAMREPTDAMVDAGGWLGGENGVGDSSARVVWTGMIEAALVKPT